MTNMRYGYMYADHLVGKEDQSKAEENKECSTKMGQPC